MRGSEPEVQNSIMDIVRHTLSPELLNRIDECVIFNRLQRENMDIITEIQIKKIAKRLEDTQSMKLDVSNSAKEVLAELGYDYRYGARPLQRVLNRELLNPMSRLVLEGSVVEGDVVRVRTRAEAEIEQRQTGDSRGWVCSNTLSDNKNDIVVMRNHDAKTEEEETWDDNGNFLLDDGIHAHR